MAQQWAQAAGDPGEKRLRRMIRRAHESALNWKLTAITKGLWGVLDKIQIPTHTWFFSGHLYELYHYNKGVFEAFPHSHEDVFHTHHMIKILPPDAVLADVSQTALGWQDGGYGQTSHRNQILNRFFWPGLSAISNRFNARAGKAPSPPFQTCARAMGSTTS